MEYRREYVVRLPLPLPLAQLYSRAFNAKDPRSRHDNAFYLFEATIKLAAAPAVACYVRDVSSAPRALAFESRHAANGRMGTIAGCNSESGVARATNSQPTSKYCLS
jgi:hypothetical protein